MIKIPPYLSAGDTIALTCPAGYMSFDKAATCITTLQQWGYRVKVGKTLGSDSDNYFSAPDDERLAEFQRFLLDDEVKAILCARGGYGTGRLVDRINFKKFRKKPKWIIGYSDITILHLHIYANFRIASLHAPMAAAFHDEGFQNEYVQSLRQALEGRKARYRVPVHEFNRRGEAVGELIGGNLSLLAHACGTASDFKTRGRILFLEDVGEYLYNIDRMMFQLKRSGKLQNLAGLVVGGFTENKDTERPFGASAYDIIADAVREFDYPVCFDFPVSHGDRNYALKCGAGYKLKVGGKKVTLEE